EVRVLSAGLVRSVALGPERVGEALDGQGLLAGDLRARLEVADLELVVEHVGAGAPRQDVVRRGEARQLRAGRTGRHAVTLDEREVDRFEAVVVARGAVRAALEAVDVERRAPVAVV